LTEDSGKNPKGPLIEEKSAKTLGSGVRFLKEGKKGGGGPSKQRAKDHLPQKRVQRGEGGKKSP